MPGNDFGHRLTETPHQSGLPGFADILPALPRQVALNLEIAFSSISGLLEQQLAQGPPVAIRQSPVLANR
jgi:hypothetical protein